MSANAQGKPVNLPFTIGMRGFDRDQVIEYFSRVDAEMRVIAADRDAAAANARELADHLDRARDEIDRLRRDVDKLSVPPTTAEGMSDRISRMLRLASDEASELRARAESDAAETISIAQQEAAALRAVVADEAAQARTEIADEQSASSTHASAVRTELDNRRNAMEREHADTMSNAKTEAARLISAAQAECERLDIETQTLRERTQEDFDITMADRRDKAIALVTELEETSKAEALQRISVANTESDRIHAHAENVSLARISRSQEVAESIRNLRGQILQQLSEVRTQLDEVPALLSSLDDEVDFLDEQAPNLINKGVDDSAQIGSSATENLPSNEQPLARYRSRQN